MEKITRVFCLILAMLFVLTAPAFAFEQLSKGSKGDAVVELQNKLNELGYSVGTADGDFGGKTVAALQQFQTDKGLEVTGILDEATYDALFGVGISTLTGNEGAKVVDMWPSLACMYILTDDGSVIYSNQVKTAVSIGAFGDSVIMTDVISVLKDGGMNELFVHADGSITGGGFEKEWEGLTIDDFMLIGASTSHAVGLKKDGTWITAGDYRNGECDVDNWTDIVQLQVGTNFTVGLKSDGTVVATGMNNYGQCNVSGWTDIIKIAVGSEHTLGLKSDGTVVATGNDSDDQCFVGRWKNVTDIYAGSDSYGLTSDGEILSTFHGIREFIPEDYRCEGAVKLMVDYNGLSQFGGGHAVLIKDDNSIEVCGTLADYYMGFVNGAVNIPSDGEENHTVSSNNAESNAQMAAVLDVFSGLEEAVDKNGDNQLTIDEIFN